MAVERLHNPYGLRGVRLTDSRFAGHTSDVATVAGNVTIEDRGVSISLSGPRGQLKGQVVLSLAESEQFAAALAQVVAELRASQAA